MSKRLIYAEDAIDALEREQSTIERPITEIRWFDLGLRKAQDVLRELPSAQPERKKGKWLFFDPPWFRCSECGATRENKTFMENFCPNCGVDMRQEERDE